MGNNMKKIVVIVPALNEETTIEDLIIRILRLKNETNNYSVLVIDDGSTDRTCELSKKSGATVVIHERNRGVGKSVRDGIQVALEYEADIAAIIDADMQYDPEDISLLIKPILEGKADFVAANRFVDSQGNEFFPDYMSPIKFWGNKQMTRLVNKLAGTSLGDVSSGFRALNKEALLNLNLSGNFTYTHEMILDLAVKELRFTSVPVKVRYFPERKSRVAGNLVHYGYQALRIIFKEFKDYKPFRFFWSLSLFPLVLGLISMLFMGIFYLVTGAFSPFKFVGFIGIYLFSIAVILIIVGFLADILVGIRRTQEKLLYFQKKRNYYNKNNH
jgi:glycosyltransferase involved in cell wall biosynthesis